MPRAATRFDPRITNACRRAVIARCREVTQGRPAPFARCLRFGHGACEVDPHATMRHLARERGVGQPPPAHAYRDGSLGTVVSLSPTYAMVGIAAIAGLGIGYWMSRG